MSAERNDDGCQWIQDLSDGQDQLEGRGTWKERRTEQLTGLRTQAVTIACGGRSIIRSKMAGKPWRTMQTTETDGRNYMLSRKSARSDKELRGSRETRDPVSGRGKGVEGRTW